MTTQSNMTFGHRKVRIYETDTDAPIVYSLDFEEDGEALLSECTALKCPSFQLVTISQLHWDEELSPWPAPSIVSKDDHFTGEADVLLRVLTEEIVPQAEAQLKYQPTFRILSGYSMAGLFALYAAYRTPLFSHIMSASGSFWFPDFLTFAENHAPSPTIQRAYFSIGDKESKTRNPYMQKTEANTRRLATLLQTKGVETCFELNAGNHFKETTLRQAKGIHWLLTEK